MGQIIKVDRVKSVEEALELESLGVQVICAEIDPIYTFSDNRKVTLDIAREIGISLKKSQFCCEFLDITKYSLNSIKDLNCKYVQCSRFSIIKENIRKTLENQEIGIIYSDFNISYDHDSDWIMISFEDENADTLNASFYDIDLVNDFDDSWGFLINECPKYLDECLQISEIDELASSYPTLISLNYSVDNINEIINSIPNMKGVSFRLGNNPTRNDVRCISYTELVTILHFLKNR